MLYSILCKNFKENMQLTGINAYMAKTKLFSIAPCTREQILKMAIAKNIAVLRSQLSSDLLTKRGSAIAIQSRKKIAPIIHALPVSYCMLSIRTSIVHCVFPPPSLSQSLPPKPAFTDV